MTAGFPSHVVGAALLLPRQYEPTDAGVSAALAALGTSAAEVAGTLRAGGFRGHRGCHGTCPLGRYLSAHLAADVTVCVDVDAVIVIDHWGSKVAEVRLSDALYEFVALFDRGAAYTDLDDALTDPAEETL